MQSGITKTKPDKRDRSFVKTFGAVSATSLPDEFDVDAGLWQPDQNALALPLGCSGFTQGDLIADQEGVIIDPGEIYRDTPPYRNDTGRDLRTSLKRICSKPSKYYLKDGEAKPRSGYYNVRPSGKIDAFDAVRIAIWVNQQEKRSVSVGSSWFWSNPPKGIAEPQKSYAWTGALGHNYKISGWKMIDGVMYLRGKPWQGDKWGDKGWIYFNREIFNKLMKVHGNEAFTVADDSAPVQTIDWNIIDTLVNFIRELFNI